MPYLLAPFIKPLSALVDNSTEDIHLLFHDSVSTPTLGIPFQDPHDFSFEHQLGLPVHPSFKDFLFLCPCFFCIGVPLLFSFLWGFHHSGGALVSLLMRGLVVLMVLRESLEPFLFVVFSVSSWRGVFPTGFSPLSLV